MRSFDTPFTEQVETVVFFKAFAAINLLEGAVDRYAISGVAVFHPARTNRAKRGAAQIATRALGYAASEWNKLLHSCPPCIDGAAGVPLSRCVCSPSISWDDAAAPSTRAPRNGAIT